MSVESSTTLSTWVLNKFISRSMQWYISVCASHFTWRAYHYFFRPGKYHWISLSDGLENPFCLFVFAVSFLITYILFKSAQNNKIWVLFSTIFLRKHSIWTNLGAFLTERVREIILSYDNTTWTLGRWVWANHPFQHTLLTSYIPCTSPLNKYHPKP